MVAPTPPSLNDRFQFLSARTLAAAAVGRSRGAEFNSNSDRLSPETLLERRKFIVGSSASLDAESVNYRICVYTRVCAESPLRKVDARDL